MMHEFMLFALLGGLSLVMITGPLGCFVVWRRMAYFGDTMAHGALLGVALSVVGSLPVPMGILAVSIVLALLLLLFSSDRRLHMDTSLGILAHGSLALSLVVFSVTSSAQLDVMRYLFGDILALSQDDVISVATISIGLLLVLIWQWRPMLVATIHPDIAQVEKVRVPYLRFVLMLMLAVVIAVSIKVVGMLLITSLLIIPAATARFVARSPKKMALIAIAVGAISVVTGLRLAYHYDTPAAPTIVVVVLGLFIISWLLRRD